MTITKIQNPYKLPPMAAFTYEEPKNRTAEKGVSAGLGFVNPPSDIGKPDFMYTEQRDIYEQAKGLVSKEVAIQMQNSKNKREVPTPTGVKIIFGLGAAALAALALKKFGAFEKIANVFRRH